MAKQKRPVATDTTSAPQFIVGLCVSRATNINDDIYMDCEVPGGHAYISYAWRDHRRWSHTRCVLIPHCGDLWDVLKELPTTHGRPHIVAPRAHDALTMCGFWERIEKGQLSIRKMMKKPSKSGKIHYHPLIMSKSCNIIGWNDGIKNYRAVSVDNLCKVGLSDIARGLMREEDIPQCKSGSNAFPLWAPKLVSNLMLEWTKWQIEWWMENRCGTWADSQGVAAMNTFRARGVPAALKTHDKETVTELESAACHGGRVAVFFGGTIGTKDGWGQLADAPDWRSDLPNLNERLIRYDVRSMYPTIMRDRRFPVKLLYTKSKCTIEMLEAACKHALAIAAVRIKTSRGEVPRSVKGGVQYPQGTFDTTIATPDILECLRYGEIDKVYCMAVYQPGEPFKMWSEWILGARNTQMINRNAAGQALCKSLSNSLAGKLGSRGMHWSDPREIKARVLWGEWLHSTAERPSGIKYRSLGGIVQEWIEAENRKGLLAACYAHITSYGRVHMSIVRQYLGPRAAVWQDTDGITIRASYADRMRNIGGLDSGQFGTFRTEEEYVNAMYYSGKTYWRDGEWVLSGIHNTWRVNADGKCDEMKISNPVNKAQRPDGGRVLCTIHHHDLNHLLRSNTYDMDGWMQPPIVQPIGDDINRFACPQLLEFKSSVAADLSASSPPPSSRPLGPFSPALRRPWPDVPESPPPSRPS